MKRLFAIVASAVIATAGQLAAQTINISTSSMDGWSIDNNSTFHINTWSTEGNSDGSNMTTPFLENWVRYGNYLPAGTWSYTATGLTANAYYRLSALVRAYNERSTTYPSGVYLYAGDGESADISSGTAIRYNDQSSGRYATLTAIGQADASGNLTIGIRSGSASANWVAMKNVTLTKVNSSLQTPQLNIWSQFGSSTIVGLSSKVGYYTNSDGTITYTTSDASVATVTSDGTVTCVGAGVVTITVHLAATSTYESATRTIQLTVKQDWNTKITPTMSLTAATTSLEPGETSATTLTYNGDGAVTYTSSNTSVATVNASGVVTAVGAGTATITASAAETNDFYAASATLNFTVTSKLLTPTLTLTAETSQAYVGTTVATTLTNSGNGAVTYTSSNTSVATVNASGVITAVGAGTATITATAAATSNYTAASATTTISVLAVPTGSANYVRVTGLDEIVSGEQYLIVYQSNATATSGYALDGNFTTSAKTAVTVADYAVSAAPAYAFTITKSGSGYVAKGVGSGKYLAPKSSTDIYADASTVVTLTESGEGFEVWCDANSRYLNYNSSGVFQGSTSAKRTLYLYMKAEMSFPSAAYSAKMGSSFSAPTLTKSPSAMNVTYTSSNTSVATVNASTGAVTLVGAGTTTITATRSATHGALSASYTLTVADERQLPTVTILPAMVTLTEGTSKTVTVDVAYYDGVVSASMVDETFATLTLASAENRVYNYSVEGLTTGTTYIKLEMPATSNYRDTTIYVPVSVLSSLYTFELVVEDAPQYGVAIEIWGTTYSGSTTFTSAHNSVSSADITVGSLSNYTSAISIEGRTITVTYSLKVPQKGSFIRLKNYSCNQYATLSADGSALTLAPSGIDNIIYYDAEGRFLFYSNGQFVKATHLMASVADAASASTFTFTRGTGDFTACYSVRSNDGKYLLGSSDCTTTSSVADNGYAFWSVEILSALPVTTTVAGYGYATLYSPVALDIPGGIMAYYVTGKTQISGTSGIEYELTLQKLISVIPAEVPTILVGTPGTTYDCTLQYADQTSAPDFESSMTGSFAAHVTADVAGAGNVFALQPNAAEETVGFYRYSQPSTKGFKAYFVSSTASGAAAIRLRFANAESETSAIVLPETDKAEADGAVYDLLGHRVADTTDGLRPGIYIRYGRKMIVRR